MANATLDVPKPSAVDLPGEKMAVTVILDDVSAWALKAMAEDQRSTVAEVFQRQVDHGLKSGWFF